MADNKQKCPMCSTKLKMINGRMTCKSCGYYYRNPNEQTGGASPQQAYGGGRYPSGTQGGNAGQYGSQKQNGPSGTRYQTSGQYGSPSGRKTAEKKKESNPAVRITGVVAAVLIGIVVSTFITLFNNGFFRQDTPLNSNNGKDRAEAIINSLGYGSYQGEEGSSAAGSDESQNPQGISGEQNDSPGSTGSSRDNTKKLPESDFFRQMAEAIWNKDYRTVTAAEYACLTALQIDRDEKTISYQLNHGDTMTLTFQSDSGKKLSDLSCFTGLEWLAVDDDLSKGDLDGLNALYALHSENSISSMADIVPNREAILELGVEDSVFSNSLDGLEAFPNLRYLSVDYGSLEDISALTRCPNLLGLALINCNRLTDYSPLMELTELEELSIDSVQLKSIDFIKEMPGLTYLSVENSMITNLNSLSYCPALDTLYLDGNYYIEDYTGFDTLENLVNLTLELNYSNTMPTFANLSGLQSLTLKYANDLSILRNAPNVTYLCLENCAGWELDAVTAMQKLTTLEIHEFSSYTESLEPLTRLPKLEALDLEDTYIYGTINEVFEIPTLTYLNLSGCRGILDFENLPANENLQCLLLDGVSLADAATYDEWGGWEGVKLSEHYEFFGGFPNLTDLYVESTGIDSIEFVENLPRLQYLDITDNNVTSLKPLENLNEFRIVWCGRNTILEKLPEDSEILVITD